MAAARVFPPAWDYDGPSRHHLGCGEATGMPQPYGKRGFEGGPGHGERLAETMAGFQEEAP